MLGNNGGLTKTGYTFAGWNTAADGSGTSYSSGQAFTMGNANVTLYARWTAVGGGGNGNGGGIGENSSTPSSERDDTDIIVNGETKGNAATSTTEAGANGQITTPVTLDENRIAEILDTLPDNGGSAGNPSVLSIPVGNDAEAAVGKLTGQMVKDMAEKNVVIEIKTNLAAYTIPAEQVKIDEASAKLGTQVELKDITVQIEIAKPSAEAVKVIENSAKSGEFTIVAPPVKFTLKCTYGGKTIDVSLFNSYVERMIAIPDGIDPAKVTTAVVVEPDGTVRHVPTQIIVIDGKYYAKINSLSNSIYTVIYNPVEFVDAANHWAKTVVNDMGFGDAAKSADYAKNSIAACVKTEIVSGRNGNMIAPKDNITRAEVAVILQRLLQKSGLI